MANNIPFFSSEELLDLFEYATDAELFKCLDVSVEEHTRETLDAFYGEVKRRVAERKRLAISQFQSNQE